MSAQLVVLPPAQSEPRKKHLKKLEDSHRELAHELIEALRNENVAMDEIERLAHELWLVGSRLRDSQEREANSAKMRLRRVFESDILSDDQRAALYACSEASARRS